MDIAAMKLFSCSKPYVTNLLFVFHVSLQQCLATIAKTVKMQFWTTFELKCLLNPPTDMGHLSPAAGRITPGNAGL
jgi:hypothetical protein